MGGFMHKLQRFARSPQGRRAVDEAKRLARDPRRRRQLDELRGRLTGGRGKRPPAGR
ncbi:MAG TPA: hypothetical protein VLA98_10555 [Solirubrobacteraceae bacterium]|nr:hypothetical protein [Solirubrobacteraceae bacterium]